MQAHIQDMLCVVHVSSNIIFHIWCHFDISRKLLCEGAWSLARLEYKTCNMIARVVWESQVNCLRTLYIIYIYMSVYIYIYIYISTLRFCRRPTAGCWLAVCLAGWLWLQFETIFLGGASGVTFSRLWRAENIVSALQAILNFWRAGWSFWKPPG
jgi:hypothetical protein